TPGYRRRAGAGESQRSLISMASAGKSAVLLLAHGSPDQLDAMAEFLRNVTGGRAIPPEVVEEIRHRYELIGGSPPHRLTAEAAELLASELKRPVYFAMRNWAPYIPDVVRKMETAGM